MRKKRKVSSDEGSMRHNVARIPAAVRESTGVYVAEASHKSSIKKVDDSKPDAPYAEWPNINQLAAFTLKDIWDNEREEKIWSQYK